MLDVADLGECHRRIAAHPFTPYSDVETNDAGALVLVPSVSELEFVGLAPSGRPPRAASR